MVLERYLGSLHLPLLSIATSLSTSLPPSLSLPPSQLVDGLILTISLLLLSTLFLIVLPTLRNRDLRNAVLILGTSATSDAPAVGKTALFKTLRHGQPPKHGTVPSMIPNDAVFIPHKAPPAYPSLRWVDFPGHARLRHKLPQYLRVAKCIVFVIDSQRFTAQARRDAELLYDVLTDRTVAERATPVLVFCNKAEGAVGIKVVSVRTRLEAELERVRMAHGSSLRSAGVAEGGAGNQSAIGEEEERALLGYEGEPFAFEQVKGGVSFAVGSAAGGDVEAVVTFARSSFL